MSVQKHSNIFIIIIFLCIALPIDSYCQKIKPGRSINRYDRGTNPNRLEADNIFDIMKMNAFYAGAGAPACGRMQPISMCKKLRNIKFPINGGADWERVCKYWPGPLHVPYIEYYVPFQKVETTEVPFTSAYVSSGVISSFLAQSAKLIDSQSNHNIKALYNNLNNLSKIKGYGIESAGIGLSNSDFEKLTDELRKFPLSGSDTDRMRAAFSSTGGKRSMEMHVVPTFFSDFMNPTYQNWVHYGAAKSWVPAKSSVPIWFSEFPSAILPIRFGNLARQYVGADMIKNGKPDNCLELNMTSSGKTPGGLIDGKMKGKLKGETNRKYCLPKYYGPKFPSPINQYKESLYATQAATAADYKALKLARAMGKAFTNGQRATFYELQEAYQAMDAKGRVNHKSDLSQFLGRRREMPRNGCLGSSYGSYLPEIWGPDYGKANKNVDGERFVSAHWRYVRGCPFCYAPMFWLGAPPPILE